MRLRLSTAGESHGPALCGILDGLPHGLPLSKADIDADLRRRQSGYGRGGRMKIERDEIEVLAGLRGGRTLGSPLAFVVRNLDHDAWTDTMSPWGDNASSKPLTRPRPGHADLAGALRFEIADARDVLERASARSTAIRVAAGSICKALLREAGIEVVGHVVAIGDVESAASVTDARALRDAAERSTMATPSAAWPR